MDFGDKLPPKVIFQLLDRDGKNTKGLLNITMRRKQ